MKSQARFGALFLAAWCSLLTGGRAEEAVSPPAIPKETPEQRDARMQWWREARFGMFIHWGVYSVAGGEWKGQPVRGIGEWIMNSANIPIEEYQTLATKFHPVKYNPAEWARIAKDAGMRYIVITSKHHDGFCLFESKVTDWDVVDATPWGKDLLKPLADECRKQGLHFCTYYSIMDWHHPAQYRGNDRAYNPTRIHPERKREYIEYMKAQLRELLESCNPEVLWFDGEWPDWYTEADGREIYAYLRQLKPELIINNRVGKGREGMEGLSREDREYVGDFGTPEQQIPANGLPGVDWESCMTMNDTWGYKQDDHNWKSAETLIRNVIDTASKGGNYLLNVGPTGEGEIPAASVERLAVVGRWMKVNGESIYGTQASPLPSTPWGRCTSQRLGDGTLRLYLHVFQWPESGRLTVEGAPGRPKAAALVADGSAVPAKPEGGAIVLDLPQKAPDSAASVIRLDLDANP